VVLVDCRMSPLETACSEPIPSRSWVRRSPISSTVPSTPPGLPTLIQSPLKYRSPFKFTGRLEKVVVDVSGELIVDSEAEFRAAMARQ